ncbi:MAG TPA: hypothetical protein VF519_02065 [Mycobacteriales bacterium]
MRLRSVRLGLAASALAVAAAPLAVQPAQAMACAPGFEVICTAIGTACWGINQVPLPDKLGNFSCELG